MVIAEVAYKENWKQFNNRKIRDDNNITTIESKLKIL